MPVTVGQNADKRKAAGYYYYDPSTSNAQTVINSAIKAATDGIVNIEAGTYVISDAIMLVSGTKLIGAGNDPDNGTIIYATFDVCNKELDTRWPTLPTTHPGYIMAVNVKNCEIAHLNFWTDCTGPNSGTKHCGGLDYKECMVLLGSSYINVHDCRQSKWTYMDFATIMHCDHINMYNCILFIGHCGCYAIKSKNIHAYNNEIYVTTNSAFRIDGSDVGGDNIEYDHNLIQCIGGGQSACELEGLIRNSSFHHNIIWDMKLCSVSKTVVQNLTGHGSFSCHDNVYWNCPGSGKGPIEWGDDGTNIKDPSDQNPQNWIKKGYGPQTTLSDPVPEAYFTMNKSSGTAQLT